MMNFNKNRLVDRFLSYVVIDSETGTEKEFADHLMKELKKLNFMVIQDKIGNIIVKMKGSKEYTPLLLSAHMDTVTPGKGVLPVVKNGLIKSQENTILGSDDKGGIAIIMETLQYITENNIEHGNLEIVFTVGEEGGLIGSTNLDYRLIDSKLGLVIDCSGDFGGIVTQAPAQNSINIKITGKASHAGNAPENGVSAIQVAARAINDMKLLKIDHETTANIGTISGGYATNIVCPEVTIKAEARSLDNNKLDKQTKHMVTCFEKAAEDFKAATDIQVERKYSAYKFSDDDTWVKFMIEVGKKINFDIKARASGGGSDANVFNSKGIKTLNIAIGMKQVHTVDEFITIKDLVNSTEYLLEVIKQMNMITP